MAEVLIRGALWVGGLCVVLIAVVAALQVAQWAALGVLAGALQSLLAVTRFIGAGSQWLARGVEAALLFVLKLAWQGTYKGLCAITRPMRTWLSVRIASLREAMQRWMSGMEGDSSGTRSGADDEADAGSAKQDPPQSQRNAYDEALALLGLLGVEPLTREALKERVREIMSRVHPDKGFPNHIFAAQINAAAQTIKKAKGWR